MSFSSGIRKLNHLKMRNTEILLDTIKEAGVEIYTVKTKHTFTPTYYM